MAKPPNPERKLTTIGGVEKTLVARIRCYAKKDPKRLGNESTSNVLNRIITEYEKEHPLEEQAPKPTY